MASVQSRLASGGVGQNEFARGWMLLLGSFLGISIGIIVIPSPAIGVFLRDLQVEFGWTRAQISLGPTILIGTLAFAVPLLGWVVDRVHPRLIVAVSLSALAISLYLFSRLTNDIRLFYAGFAAMAVTASGSATVVYARVLSSSFFRHRGLALGLAMTGGGITGVLLPLLLTPYAAENGWRAGFVALALVVAVATPAVIFLMGGTAATASPRSNSSTSLGDAVGDRAFWLMLICAGLIPFAVSGLQLHLITYLADMGMTLKEAGLIASVSGASLAIARVLTGYLIDRIHAPWVAAAVMAFSALGLTAMTLLGPSAAMLGAVAIGVAMGAELDLIGYMTARYFGLDRFGRIYGIQYSAVLVGAASSPFVYGWIADTTGTYQAALIGASVLLSLCSALFLALPRMVPSMAAPVL
ncbi:MFS transporter [Sphingobium xenophagum]|uniref:MFS transporter n=1 Tax=Sphingobium xenophagum TaxID=121428 RepID=UPI00039B6CBC|nr:MFS transporter [Sphingobium xenophagum]